MTGLTDAQLLLLEQLTYINDGVLGAAGLPQNGGVNGIRQNGTVADLINRFMEDGEAGLNRLLAQADKDISALMNGGELAAIIRAIYEDPALMSLKLTQSDERIGAYCFEDSEGKAIVIFRGTTTGEEWFDNFTGLGVSDTTIQREALDFVNNLNYDDITTVGHSKGGNKAMYCAILLDKVTRAVSMDGQGFSNEFLHKYEEEIRRKASVITNYSLSGDYVHILLYQPEGAKQVYVEGNDYVNGAKNHCPGSFFRFVEEDGVWYIEMAGGGPTIYTTTENEGMTYLHEFTTFVLEVCPIEKRQQIGDYLGCIMACMMRKYPDPGYYHFTDSDGIEYTSQNIQEFIFKHPDLLGLVIAYIMKYGELHNMTEGQLRALIRALGFEETVTKFEAAINSFAGQYPVVAAGLGLTGMTIFEILKLIMSNIVDGKRDPLIEKLLEELSGLLSEKLGFELNLDQLWQSIEAEYTAIGSIDAATNSVNTLETVSKTFDYSNAVYQRLMNTLNRIDSLTSGNLSGWNASYGSEPWFHSLGISIFVNGIHSYSNNLAAINQECRAQINTIFIRVQEIDQSKASQLLRCEEMADRIKGKLQNLAAQIG